ncbi:hypothetical protein EI71_00520 [Anaeroplasma bactoclasticum]|jgi:predicted RNA-binding Zn-ribbon protein involved in translation (DUF1610 family)|uniref:Replication restart DNA helicase PriA n=1 Tax=Anaeroplasma bactoclasticum TaxID=2088 RepID=A0A397RWT2_9MOLU|nr:hypothetical protein [Anaeroplasma bactoclasticum]RIA78208.1 hypothetical protein EI71_00520 [Anaeroplasma bactoclasticum]
MEGTTFICPSCGGKLSYDAKEKKLLCINCNNTYTTVDLMKIDRSIDDIDDELEADYFNKEDNTIEYTCSSCGGSIIVEDSIASSACPFCGNNVLLKNSLVGAFRPKYIVPFSKKKEDAEAIKRHYLNKNPFLPFGFKNVVKEKRPNDIYIPLYSLRGKVSFDFSVIQSQNAFVSIVAADKEETDRTIMITLFGKVSFNHFPMHALKHDYDDIIKAIGPFDLKGIKQFDTPYLAGHMAKRLEIPFRDLKNHATLQIESDIREYFQNPETLRNLYIESGKLKRDSTEGEALHATNFNVIKMESSYTFYPMWFIEPTFKDKKYTIIINDQNGAIYGNIPLSKLKVFGFTVFFLALFEQISYWLVFLMNKSWLPSLIISLCISALLTTIVMVSLYKSNYSYKKRIEDYIVPNSCSLSNIKEVNERKSKVRSFENEMEELSAKIREQKKYISTGVDIRREQEKYQNLLIQYQGLINVSEQFYKRRYEEEIQKVDTYTKEDLENLITAVMSEKSVADGRLLVGKINKQYRDVIIKYCDKRIELYQNRLKKLEE